MSLNSKQIREIQSLYESVYAPKVENENQVVITHEEFDELCASILQEVLFQENVDIYLQEGQDFNEIVLHEDPVKSQIKSTVRSRVMKHLVKPALKKIKDTIIPKTLGGLAVRFGGYEAVKSKPVRDKAGEVVRTGGAMANNAIPFARDAYHAATTNKTMHGNVMSKVDDKGDRVFTTRPGVEKNIEKLTKKNLKNSFEYSNDKFEILVVEKEEDKSKILDLINQKKKDEDKDKGAGKTNTNPGGGDGGKTNGNTTPPKNDGKKNGNGKKNEVDTSNTDAFDYGKEKDKDGNIIKRKQPSAEDQLKIIDKAREKEAAISKQELNQKDPDDPTSKSNTGAPEYEPKPEKTDKKNEIKKDKPKQYSTPIKDKTDLGSPIKPIKPRSARDIARARNEIKFGSDHVGKLVNKQADFKAYKRGDITKQQFADKYPNSQVAKALKKSKLPPSVMDFESYQPYDLVLDYIITEGHADTVEEAHYVMTQMDAETIQTIIAEYEIV